MSNADQPETQTTPEAEVEPEATTSPATTPATTPPDTESASTASVAGAEPEAESRSRRKVREGLVTSTKMQSTAVVAVTERVRHRRYAKTVQQTKKLYVHDADNDARVGDRVRVMETRPMSRTKRWRLLEIVERAR